MRTNPEIEGEQRLEAVKINFLSSPDDFVRKYSLTPGETGQIGDPRVLDYLTPPVIATLGQDFVGLSSTTQERLGFAIHASLAKNQNNKLWRALVISQGGRAQLGNRDFAVYLDGDDDNLVLAEQEQDKDRYTVISGKSRGSRVKPVFADLTDLDDKRCLITNDEVMQRLVDEANKVGLKNPKDFFEAYYSHGFDNDHFARLLTRKNPQLYFNLARLLLIGARGVIPNPTQARSYFFLKQEMGNQNGIGNLSMVRKERPTQVTEWRKPRHYSDVFPPGNRSGENSIQVLGLPKDTALRRDVLLNDLVVQERVVVPAKTPLHALL